ncbi:13264_t:CDS:2, partial [Dentiscutata heterogama]
KVQSHNIASSSYASTNTAVPTVNSEDSSTHYCYRPESSKVKREETNQKLTMQRIIFGIHLPLRHIMEQSI